MARLLWKEFVPWSLASFGIAVTAFSRFCVTSQAGASGGGMSWQSWALLSISVACLTGSVVFASFAVARHEEAGRLRNWKFVAVGGLAALVVLASVRFYRVLTEFGQGVLFGAGGLLILEGIRRLLTKYVLDRSRRRAHFELLAISGRENANLLRHLFVESIWSTAACADQFFRHEILKTSQGDDGARLTSDLLDTYPMERLKVVCERTQARLRSGELIDLKVVIEMVMAAMVDYASASKLVLRAALAAGQGSTLPENDRYKTWKYAQGQLTEEIRKLTAHQEIGGLAGMLLVGLPDLSAGVTLPPSRPPS